MAVTATEGTVIQIYDMLVKGSLTLNFKTFY